MGHLYRLFRGEFVKKSSAPLSSDAYSNLSYNQIDITEIKNANNALLNNIIPSFSNQLHEFISINQLENNPSLLCEIIHKEGINLRFLGLIYENISSDFEFLKNYIIAEILARSLKNFINKKMREISVFINDDIFNIILCIFSDFFSSHDNKFEDFITLNLIDYLTNFHASDINFSLLSDKLPKQWLFNRISSFLGINWFLSNDDTLNIFYSGKNITLSLIRTIDSHVKYVRASVDNFMNVEKLQILYRNQITMRESYLGSLHPLLADSLENLAGSLESNHSHFKEAESCLLKAIQIRETYTCKFNLNL